LQEPEVAISSEKTTDTVQLQPEDGLADEEEEVDIQMEEEVETGKQNPRTLIRRSRSRRQSQKIQIKRFGQ
jgi:hypothetical protein